MATGLFNLKQVNQAISQGAWSGYIAPRWVEYLVVAGGGGAGSGNTGGGGGGGGLLTGIVTVTAGTSYTVTVGSGGAGGSGPSSGSTGVSSVFGSISSTGGGGGSGDGNAGLNGGSGGGGGGNIVLTPGGSGTSGQGNAGGGGQNTSGLYAFLAGGGVFGGGGGAAGTVGTDRVIGPPGRSGNGGSGIASAITGTVTTFSGGGGGGGDGRSVGGLPGVGGVGGGGNGSLLGVGGAGTANTGGGGGGGGFLVSPTTFYVGGTGGSGIVVVRYPGNVQFFTGGTVNYNNGYIIHIFTANGTLAPTTPAPYNTSYQISRSLRFNSADSAYLARTPASASNRKTWTWSAWIKRGKITSDADLRLFEGRPDAGTYTIFDIINTGSGTYPNTLRFIDNNGSTVQTTAVYRDPSAWYHLVLSVDTTQATASNRVKIYVNGSEVTSFVSSTYPTQNLDMQINTATEQAIGRDQFGVGGQYYDGLMTEINFVDGTQLTPSSFGATSTTTGVWSPIQYSGTYGTNGFYLNFSDNSNTTAATLGKDYSGNGNNWTPYNFSVTAGVGNDSMVDSPTQYGFDTGVGGTVRGNYCTINSLLKGANLTIANGNLGINSTGSAWTTAYGTFLIPTSGKWYWEVTVNGPNANPGIALSTSNLAGNLATYPADTIVSYTYYGANGNRLTGPGNTSAAYGASFTTNDVVGMALDMDAGTLTFYKNGSSQGAAFSNLAGNLAPYVPVFGAYDSGVQNTNFGQRPFAYTAPSGFKALCTQNLPTPTIGATSTTLAGKFFNTVLYTGVGTTQSITVGFQPDFVWAKRRAIPSNHSLNDSIRGTSRSLFSDSTSAEDATAGYYVTAFNSDGFSVNLGAETNGSGQTYVAWNWKANGAGSTNSAGSITSTVSANTTSGFSIVTYTGNATDNATIGHGLGVAPALLIGKSRNAVGAWPVWINATGFGVSDYLALNSTDAKGTAVTLWGGSNASAPTSTVFKVGNGGSINGSGTTYVVYCFAPIAGFSAFGSYTGNGSTDGTFVYLGFRPAYMLIKASSAVDDWAIMDVARSPYNGVNLWLNAEDSSAEATLTPPQFDFNSNGMKLRGTSSTVNGSGVTYIYMAFASNPFKTSLAR